MNNDIDYPPRTGSWQRRQRELREARERTARLRGPLPAAKDPAVRKTQRDAFVQGCKHIRDVYYLPARSEQAGADYNEALRRFPKELKRTVPREVIDSYGVRWRFRLSTDPSLEPTLEYCEHEHGPWWDVLSMRAGSPGPTVERIKLWAELVERPTMEVPA
jgi:hypothetical protein